MKKCNGTKISTKVPSDPYERWELKEKKGKAPKAEHKKEAMKTILSHRMYLERDPMF